jgi:signal transduction histidine kinase
LAVVVLSLSALSNRQAALLVAELRSVIRRRDEQLVTMEHELNNEIGTLQLVAQLMRNRAMSDSDRNLLLDALAQTAGRIRRALDAVTAFTAFTDRRPVLGLPPARRK